MASTFTPRRTARSHKASELALEWLRHDRNSSTVLATANQFLAIEELLHQKVRFAADTHCKVAHIEGQRITLAVPSPAYAARLRQCSTSILQCLHEVGWKLTDVQVMVQASLGTNSHLPKPARNVQPLDAQALDAFQDLHQSLEPGPLATAIAKLIKNHGPT